MKIKSARYILFIVIAVVCSALILNIGVTTKQGVNYKVGLVRMPLYLKILDFFDRHYNYKLTVAKILGDSREEGEKAMKIFAWTNKNIRKTPSGYPIIDDHMWHIIVRGYGEPDQFSDVFTTLCNYARVNAFYRRIYTEKEDSSIILSFINIKGRWRVFDPYNGVYFKNNQGELADMEQIAAGNWSVEAIGSSAAPNIDYAKYLSNLPVIGNTGLIRPNIQSPVKRLQYEIRRWLK